MPSVLFVCTGNTCRSPMAEAIARHCIENNLFGDNLDLQVASAGVFSGGGTPPTPEVIEVLGGLEITHSGLSSPLTIEQVREADLIFCMTANHREAVRELLASAPEHQDKVQMLDPQGDIEDPIGMGRQAYDDLAQHFMKLIPQRLKEVFVP